MQWKRQSVHYYADLTLPLAVYRKLDGNHVMSFIQWESVVKNQNKQINPQRFFMANRIFYLA